VSIKIVIAARALSVGAARVGPSREEGLDPLARPALDAAIETPGLATGRPAGAQ